MYLYQEFPVKSEVLRGDFLTLFLTFVVISIIPTPRGSKRRPLEVLLKCSQTPTFTHGGKIKEHFQKYFPQLTIKALMALSLFHQAEQHEEL